MRIGIRMTSRIGVVYETMKRIEKAGTIQFRNALTPNGIVLSMLSISLEKRLSMRPRGVVSKKDIGAFRIDMRRF